jgi:hypothetical protein
MAYREHTVKQGDCISSIAFKYGFFPDTIWNDSKNSQLKQDRKDPNILLSGDVVYIRDKVEKEESCAAEQRHRFQRKGVPARFRLQLLKGTEPRSNTNFVLWIDGAHKREGVTDADGVLDVPIPPDAQQGELYLDDDGQTIRINFGKLDPLQVGDGVAQRLYNLGLLDKVDASKEELAVAIRFFQRTYGLKPTGEADKPTQEKLSEVHDTSKTGQDKKE